MKISKKVLSIPPYISTRWDNIEALTMESGDLIILLVDGSRVVIPELTIETRDQVFEAHARAIEEESDHEDLFMEDSLPENPFEGLKPKMKINFSSMPGSLGDLGNLMEHNSEQSNLPDLPSEAIEKVVNVARALAPEDLNMIPPPEPHCNCMHCQISRAVHKGLNEDSSSQDEECDEQEITDEDLSFADWRVRQLDTSLYEVTNPIDSNETYQVFLGDPIGCTCGDNKCEHIKAVLNS